MSKTLRTIGKQVELARMILANAEKEDVNAGMATYQCDENLLNEGRELLAQAEALKILNGNAHIAKKQAVKQLQEKALEAKRYFWDLAAIAKQVLSPQMVDDLKLSGRRKVSFLGWFTEANNFYGHVKLIKGVPEKLARFGVTDADLEKGRQLHDDLIPLISEKINKCGLAKLAVAKKDVALKCLAKWNSDYLSLLKRAFKHNPQHLERFGYTVRSAPCPRPALCDVAETQVFVKKRPEKPIEGWSHIIPAEIAPPEGESFYLNRNTCSDGSSSMLYYGSSSVLVPPAAKGRLPLEPRYSFGKGRPCQSVSVRVFETITTYYFSEASLKTPPSTTGQQKKIMCPYQFANSS